MDLVVSAFNMKAAEAVPGLNVIERQLYNIYILFLHVIKCVSVTKQKGNYKLEEITSMHLSNYSSKSFHLPEWKKRLPGQAI